MEFLFCARFLPYFVESSSTNHIKRFEVGYDAMVRFRFSINKKPSESSEAVAKENEMLGVKKVKVLVVS